MSEDHLIDESWKEKAGKEKESGLVDSSGQPLQSPSETSAAAPEHGHVHDGHCGCGAEGEPAAMEVNFLNYLMSLGFQAMVFLGDIPNPATNAVEKHFQQAKFLIDTLTMLRDKTKGNLSAQEDNILNASIYELQMRYVEVVAKKDQP
ncbi:MAG: DUF1844 domain-containing protein [Candidatus Omnitrophica bacterium]|nr:DUF1844 domain-containing protein [Candidatus Omnitrophota bacterium]